MKAKILYLLLLVSLTATAQIGIGTTDPKAVLDIKSTNQASPSSTDGILVPKIDTFPIVFPGPDQQGMIVYLTTTVGTNLPGFYYWDDPTDTWISMRGTNGTLDQAYDFVFDGNGRTITADTGPVLINGTDGFVSTGTLFSGATAPSGAGVKMFWLPSKAAFRAGNISNLEWDDNNIGLNSFALGFNTTASGDSSSAFGSFTFATGIISTAFGGGTSASGHLATAFGHDTVASGMSSTAFGFNSNASGQSSTAFGEDTVANNNSSTAFGRDTVASGDLSTAFGFNSNASGQASTAFGENTISSGQSSTAFGDNTMAFGNFSTAFGVNNNAHSYGEVVIGIGATNYVASSQVQFGTANATDRLFVIGNAIDTNNNNVVDIGESSDAMVVLKNGNTGIGSSTPQDKLHVVGNIRMVDGNEAAGRLMVSDANGTASWNNAIAIASGTLDQAYDFGGTGNGRTITADTGAVLINGSDGLVSTGTSGFGAVAPSGAGVKMFWNPRNAAFRAGIAGGTDWDNANIGVASVAFGNNTIASGDHAMASGFNTRATGDLSTVFGDNTIASGNRAAAFGFLTTAFGESSTAFGSNNLASGVNSFTIGHRNTARSFGETVIGIGATGYASSSNGATEFRVANAADRVFTIGNAIDANNSGTVDLAERSDAMVVLKNGNTGIGISTPVTKLQLQTSSNATKTLFTEGLLNSGILITTDFIANNFTPGLFWNTTNNNATKPKASIFLQETNLGTSMLFGTSNNYAIGITNNGIVIDPSGNVGVGTTAPARRLHVSNGVSGGTANGNAGILLESNTNVYQHFLSPNANESGLLFGSNTSSIHGGIIFDNSDEDISFRTGGNTTRMTLINTGDLGIGTSTPDRHIEVEGTGDQFARITSSDGNQAGIELLRTGNSGNDWRLWDVNGELDISRGLADFTSEQSEYKFSTTAFTPSSDVLKNLGISTRKWISVFAFNGTIQTSDRREKHEIQPLNYGLNKIMSLQPVTFKWINNKIDNGSKHLGFIAQDLQQTIPEVVINHEWSQSNESGVPVWSETERLGVNYAEIIPVLVKGMQEQQALIVALQKRIEELEKQ